MDGLTFISKVIEFLAWPLVALILGLAFRKRLLELIPYIRKFKAGPLEAEFDRAAKQVLESAAQVSANTEQPVAQADVDARAADAEIVSKLSSARNDPAAMILGGWKTVESELALLCEQLDPETTSNATSAYSVVVSSGVLPISTRHILTELRILRNQVAHDEVAPTADAAQDYLLAVGRVIELIRNYRKNLANYRPATR